MMVPSQPKIYHIVHVDRLTAIVQSRGLRSDADMHKQAPVGSTIGMTHIKQRRLSLPIKSHPGLMVGQCVPFYFCPRSVMLYIIYSNRSEDLQYTGGQAPIVHLEADLTQVIDWAEHHQQRWSFTNSNAGSTYFMDFANRAHLGHVNWTAVQARDWRDHKEGKQAEFLLEQLFPWALVERIGVKTLAMQKMVLEILQHAEHRPRVELKTDWYY